MVLEKVPILNVTFSNVFLDIYGVRVARICHRSGLILNVVMK